jgi:hypothetical protein
MDVRVASSLRPHIVRGVNKEMVHLGECCLDAFDHVGDDDDNGRNPPASAMFGGAGLAGRLITVC